MNALKNLTFTAIIAILVTACGGGGGGGGSVGSRSIFQYGQANTFRVLSAGSLYTKQQSAAREADQRLPNGFSAAC